jgi:hypothetical protein
MTAAASPDRHLATPFLSGVIFSVIALAGGFGLLLLAVPHLMLEVTGTDTSAGVIALARLLGLSLLYVAFLHGWQARAYCGPALRSMLWANVLQDALSALVVFVATAQGAVNALGWLLGGVFALMALVNALAVQALSGGKIGA